MKQKLKNKYIIAKSKKMFLGCDSITQERKQKEKALCLIKLHMEVNILSTY